MAEEKIPKLKDVKQFRFRTLSKEELEKVSKRIAQENAERERHEEERWKPKTEIIGICSCKGKVVLETTYTSEYDSRTGPMRIGPGSREQYHRVEHTECFCQNCGLVYKEDIVRQKQKK